LKKTKNPNQWKPDLKTPLGKAKILKPRRGIKDLLRRGGGSASQNVCVAGGPNRVQPPGRKKGNQYLQSGVRGALKSKGEKEALQKGNGTGRGRKNRNEITTTSNGRPKKRKENKRPYHTV